VFNLALNHATRLNNFTMQRDSLQILEQFSSATFPVKGNVSGFFDSFEQTFTIQASTIDNIPLKPGVEFRLVGQDRPEENGRYTVMTVGTKYSILKKATAPARNDMSDSSQFEPGFLCYNHPELQSKGLCESPFDPLGNPKPQKTYWDKPCDKNTQCPFYQANKNYPNYRGGCIDGRCEMPIGVKAVSYRKYEPNAGFPFCHGCKDATNPKCCDEQKNKTIYPLLKSPDYAFELDAFERRRNASLKTRS
jgi:hypothetical protein